MDLLVTAYGRRFKGKLDSYWFTVIEQERSAELMRQGDPSNIDSSIIDSILSTERVYIKKTFDALADFLIIFAKNHAVEQNKVLLRALFASIGKCIFLVLQLPSLTTTFRFDASDVAISNDTLPTNSRQSAVTFSSTSETANTSSKAHIPCPHDDTGCSTYNCGYFHHESLAIACYRAKCSNHVTCRMFHAKPSLQLPVSAQRNQ